MTDLFVVVGTHAAGKSTLIRRVCEVDYDLEYFNNDKISVAINKIFGIKNFNIGHVDKWEKLSKLGNIYLASYYLHIILMLQIKGEIAFAEGYRYYFKGERQALECAAKSAFGKCNIYYVHINPDINDRNKFLKSRGRNKSFTDEELDKYMKGFDFSFCDYEVSNRDEFVELVINLVGANKMEISNNSNISIPYDTLMRGNSRDINNLKIYNLGKFGLYMNMLIKYANKILNRLINRRL